MSGTPVITAATVLEQLGVPKGRVLYVQSSVDWLQKAGLGAPDMLSTLINWAGAAGTVVMPSYPFHSTHHDYLAAGPVFDVRRTPASIGLLPEMFRRTARVVRSCDPDFSVCALGADADAIVGDRPAEPDPFGLDSSYHRMLQLRTTLVGLGVSVNTNSFIHAIDSRAAAAYPESAYEDREYATTVIDAHGASQSVTRKCLKPVFQQLTQPSAITKEMQPLPAAYQTLEINGARFFRWDLAAWSSWCLSHATAQAASREWPCWLRRLSNPAVHS